MLSFIASCPGNYIIGVASSVHCCLTHYGQAWWLKMTRSSRSLRDSSIGWLARWFSCWFSIAARKGMGNLLPQGTCVYSVCTFFTQLLMVRTLGRAECPQGMAAGFPQRRDWEGEKEAPRMKSSFWPLVGCS